MHHLWFEKRDEDWTGEGGPLVNHGLKRARCALLIEHQAIAYRQRHEDAFGTDLDYVLHFVAAPALQGKLKGVIEGNGLRRKRLPELRIGAWRRALEVVKPNWLIASPAFLCVALSTQPLISLKDEEEAAPSKDLFDLHANG